jgi:hypothetical protein
MLATVSTWPTDCWFACWRLPFFIQTVLTLPIGRSSPCASFFVVTFCHVGAALAAFFVPQEHLDLRGHRLRRQIHSDLLADLNDMALASAEAEREGEPSIDASSAIVADCACVYLPCSNGESLGARIQHQAGPAVCLARGLLTCLIFRSCSRRK